MESIDKSNDKSKKTIDLKIRADQLASLSLSPSTKKNYLSDFSIFAVWCEKMGYTYLPASTETISQFLADLTGRKYSSIARMLTSISRVHQIAGYNSPTISNKIKMVLKGLRRELGISSEQTKPLSWRDITKMIESEPESFYGLRNRAILALGWTSAMRRSEICSLNIEDIDFIEEGIIVTIKKSKTDQEKSGVKIFVPESREIGICPVKCLKRYISRLHRDTGPLFVRCFLSDLWFADKKQLRLTSQSVTKIVKKMVRQIGLCSLNYSAHSMRRGFATECGRLGIPERFIARQTNHKNLVVLRKYIDEGEITENNPLPTIYRKLAAGTLVQPRPIECPSPIVREQSAAAEDEGRPLRSPEPSEPTPPNDLEINFD